MLCLMESHEIFGIVDNIFDDPGATYFKTIKQYNNLLKGRIVGSVTPDVLRLLVELESARDVWCKPQFSYEEEEFEQGTSRLLFPLYNSARIILNTGDVPPI